MITDLTKTMNPNKQLSKPLVVHLINDMGLGGAQKTLKNLARSEDIIISLLPNFFSALYKLISLCFSSKQKIFLFTWLYHSNLIACILKMFFFKKIKHFANIRNGYSNPRALKYSTRMVAISATKLGNWGMIDLIIFCSESALKDHESNKLFHKVKNIVVRNGIETKDRNLRRVFPDEAKFLIVARFEKQKNFSFLRACLPGLIKRDVNLTILTDQTEELIKFLSLKSPAKIKVVGNNNFSAEGLFKTSTCSILMSSSEGFANVHLEALSHGCNIISTKVGDAEIFPEKWCHLIETNVQDFLTCVDDHYFNYNPKKFKQEHKKKLMYLKKVFPPKTINDYTASNEFMVN